MPPEPQRASSYKSSPMAGPPSSSSTSTSPSSSSSWLNRVSCSGGSGLSRTILLVGMLALVEVMLNSYTTELTSRVSSKQLAQVKSYDLSAMVSPKASSIGSPLLHQPPPDPSSSTSPRQAMEDTTKGHPHQLQGGTPSTSTEDERPPEPEASTVAVEVAPTPPPRTCLYGGLETEAGCICGLHTRGESCEELTVSQESWDAVTVCGPDCWSVFVWYTTDNFKFRPLEPEKSEMDKTMKEEMLPPLLAWHDGGEFRGKEGEGNLDLATTDPKLWRIMTFMGPWSQNDKLMIKSIRQFRKDVLPTLAHMEKEPRLKAPAEGGVRIIFALMLFQDSQQFEALWNAINHDRHYYLIHIDASPKEEDLRAKIKAIIDATPTDPSKPSVWDRVHILEPEWSIDCLWGDISLVYSEWLMWQRALELRHWDWDYFINLSGSDIPVLPHEDINAFLTEWAPTTFVYYHNNTDEFRQQHVMPAKRRDPELMGSAVDAAIPKVVVFSTRQKDFNSGKYREEVGITRLHGNSQWHMLHRNMVYKLVSTAEIAGLLFSYKQTAIPDESFFSAAVVWLHKQDTATLPLDPSDRRFWNEGTGRDISAPGELSYIAERAGQRAILFARKSLSALITCEYTNFYMNLINDCSKYKVAVQVGDGEKTEEAVPQ